MLSRLVLFITTIWFAASLSFFVLRAVPGEALDAQLAQGGATQVEIDAARDRMGLNAPLYVQYGLYLSHLAQGDLGISLTSGLPVRDAILARLTPTIVLAASTTLLSMFLSLVVGYFCSLQTSLGRVFRLLVSLSLSMPIYWTATLAIMLIATTVAWIPSSGSGTWQHLLLPVSILTFHVVGPIGQVLAANIRDTRMMSYVQAAYGRGLSIRQVETRYVLRIALLPAISLIGLQLGVLLSGTIIIESIFVRPGIGRLLLSSVLSQDYPMVQGIVIMSAVFFLTINLLADFVHRLLDPRLVTTR